MQGRKPRIIFGLLVIVVAIASMAYVAVADRPDAIRRPAGSTDGAAMSVWHAALLSRTNTPATWVAVGESITEGQGAPVRTERWLDLTARQLRMTYQTFGVSNEQQYTPAVYRVGPPDSPWTDAWSKAIGTVTPEYTLGSLGYRAVKISDGAQVTYTVYGDSADIWYMTSKGSGRLEYTADGGKLGSIDAAGTTDKPVIRKRAVRLGSAGRHSITLGAAQEPVYFAGLTTYDADRAAGIHVYDAGYGGATVATFLQDPTNFKRSLGAVKPQLISVELGVNDYEVQTSPSTFKSRMQTLLADIRSVPGNPSILLIIPYQIYDKSEHVYAYSEYVQQMRSLAAADPKHVAVLDLSVDMSPATKSGAGYYSTDGIHPNGFGQQVMEQLVYDSITR